MTERLLNFTLISSNSSMAMEHAAYVLPLPTPPVKIRDLPALTASMCSGKQPFAS